MTDDAARRERAEKWVDGVEADKVALATSLQMCAMAGRRYDLRSAYLAGATGEAAIQAKKIQNLRNLVKSQEQEIDRMHSEIAALRKAVRVYYDSLKYEGASDARLMIGINESVVRRALEEQP